MRSGAFGSHPVLKFFSGVGAALTVRPCSLNLVSRSDRRTSSPQCATFDDGVRAFIDRPGRA